jgi:hypothetical protein
MDGSLGLESSHLPSSLNDLLALPKKVGRPLLIRKLVRPGYVRQQRPGGFPKRRHQKRQNSTERRPGYGGKDPVHGLHKGQALRLLFCLDRETIGYGWTLIVHMVFCARRSVIHP